MSRQRDGQIIWQNNTFKDPKDAMIHVLSHSLHYGSAVFEGTRVYETQRGPAVFRLNDHLDRLFYSAHTMGMTLPYTQDDIFAATVELVRRNGFPSCYLRHIAYYGYGNLRVMPTTDIPVEMAIACWPWGTYLSDEPIHIVVSDYIRIHPRSTVPDAKIAGHYVNCILSGLKIKGTIYKEALFLDADGYVSEVGSANFFIVKNKKIYTPPRGTILPGITRNTVVEIAQHLGYEVYETQFTLAEVYQADEAFLTGTAAEITLVGTLNSQAIGAGSYPVAMHLHKTYMDVVAGRQKQFLHYLTFVNP